MKGSTKRKRRITILRLRRTCNITLGIVDANNAEVSHHYSRLTEDHFTTILGIKHFIRGVSFPKLPPKLIADPQVKFFVRIHGRIMKNHSYNVATFDLTDPTKPINHLTGEPIDTGAINWAVVSPYINRAIKVMVRDVYER